MTLFTRSLKGWLPAIGGATPAVIMYITVLSVVLTIAHALHMSAAQTVSWIAISYGLPSLLSILLTIRYRQPIILTANLFALILYASLAEQLSFGEIIGASIVAGAIVVLISSFGLTGWLAEWVPEPIVFGMLAGAIIPYVFGLFTALGGSPLLVGGIFLAYLLGRLFLGTRLPAILPALTIGLVIAAISGRFGGAPIPLGTPDPVITMPIFSLHGILTATPILVVVTTLQANVPSIIYMRSQGYQPPEKTINIIGGIGTMFGSILGPMAISIPLPFMPLLTGPEAGAKESRHRAVYIVAVAAIIIAAVAKVAASVPTIVPMELLLTLVGLSMVGVLATSLQQITCGPLMLGPMFAFAVALSKISFLGFGPFFWSLVVGIGISLLLERDKLRLMRASEAA